VVGVDEGYFIGALSPGRGGMASNYVRQQGIRFPKVDYSFCFTIQIKINYLSFLL
jgi:hypothetical protein